MDAAQSFFFGFIIAGLIGWLSSLINKSWKANEKTQKLILFDVPNPALKPIMESDYKSIGTVPEQSPLQVLIQGCLKLIGQLLVQAILLVSLGLVVLFTTQQTITADFFLGNIFAAIFTFLLGAILTNWKKISNLYKIIFNPPSPSLNKATSPNNHYVAAKPAISVYDAVVGGSIEIIGRLIWELVLIGALFLLLRAVYVYLSD